MWRMACLVLSATTLFACAAPQAEREPETGSTSYAVLDDELERASTAVERIERALPAEARPPVEPDLVELRTALFHLQRYYVPVLQARDQCIHAYRASQAGQTEEAARLLDEARRSLDKVAEFDAPAVRGRMEDLLARIDRVAEELEIEPGKVPADFEILLYELEMAFLRGELVISGSPTPS